MSKEEGVKDLNYMLNTRRKSNAEVVYGEMVEQSENGSRKTRKHIAMIQERESLLELGGGSEGKRNRWIKVRGFIGRFHVLVQGEGQIKEDNDKTSGPST